MSTAPVLASQHDDRDHSVLFYEDTRVLFERVAKFVMDGLAAGQPALLVAQPDHLSGFRRALEAKGIEVESAMRKGEIVTRDARETLAMFSIDGVPDRARFMETVGTLVGRLAEGPRGVRVYGEMVDLLCRDGQPGAAIALENFWNELASTCDFSLFCSYAMGDFAGDDGSLFRAVCGTHDHVHPLEKGQRHDSESFRLLVESVRDYAIFMLDPRGIVRTWNAGAERIKGYRADEIVGRHFSTFYTRSDLDTGKCERELAVAGAEGRFEDEGWRVRKDGTHFWANVVITALRNEKSELVGFAKVTRDLSERKRAEEERIRLARAEEANRVKDEFLATFSHELRTPLNSILGWAKLLAGRDTDPYVAKGLETIARNAQVQAQLVEDLLDVSRISSGKLELAIGAVDLGSVVGDAIEAVRPSAQAKGVELRFEPARGPVRLLGDATRLQQVAWNLLMNAVKFTDRGGTIVVTLESRASSATLRVRDTGRGIEKSFLPHVFERFRQHDSSAARRAGGLGLGLALVRHIVELHGGNVSAESDGPGLGSSFTVDLPTQESPRERSSERRARDVVRLDGVTVLVVEDEPDSRELVAMMLENQGAKVTMAASAREARAHLERERPDVIVSDVGMPGEDGYSFVRSLRALPRERGGEIPVIALTAYASPTERQRALDAGFVNHVSKPVHPEEILSVIRNVASIAQSK